MFCAFDEVAPVEELVPNPRNPNQHSEAQVQLLGSIIAANGWREAVTVSRRSGYIVKGHGRRLAALAKGLRWVPVQYQEYASEAEEWADLVADNRLAELSSIDEAQLADLLQDFDGGEAPLELTGYTTEDIAAIFAEAGQALGVDAGDEADGLPELPEELRSRRGDLWLLGDHRLLVGDATNPEDAARLMDGEKAALVHTDPPYGVEYVSQSGRFEQIENDGLHDDDLLNGLLIPAFRNLVAWSRDDAAFYIWHASTTARDFQDAMTAAGLMEKQTIVWVKPAAVLGHADYHWMHEPCFYAEKAGASAAYYGDRSQKTVWKATLRDRDRASVVLTGGVLLLDGAGGQVFVSEKPPKNKKLRKIRLSDGRSVSLLPLTNSATAWEISKDSHIEHPNQKPVELPMRAIDNSSRPGELVADFFGGSGSTLLGAHLAGRRCNTMELDPRHADLIVERYVRLAGSEGVVCQRDGKLIVNEEVGAE